MTAAIQIATGSIITLSIAGVVIRPWNLPEAVWAVGGSAVLVASGLLPAAVALRAVGEGTDVYLFLVGMMLLAELARREGVFDFVASAVVRGAAGSASRLFALVYTIGAVVTVFMSNDATAVVLTPAVLAAAKKAGARPLPYLFACALVANAASFVLPISNPANLVVFGSHLPVLSDWFTHFAWPSLAAVLATFGVLRWRFRAELGGAVEAAHRRDTLSGTGKLVAGGLAVSAATLLAASGAGLQLGWPTLSIAGLLAAVVLLAKRAAPWALLRSISWSVLPLVAGLFVLVQALERTGAVALLGDALHRAAQAGTTGTAWAAGSGFAVALNLVNNLPAGLIARSALMNADASDVVRNAVAIGVDLGPNLSVTGSLATILWLLAIRREGIDVTAMQFLKIGALAMPVALIAALAALWI